MKARSGNGSQPVTLEPKTSALCMGLNAEECLQLSVDLERQAAEVRAAAIALGAIPQAESAGSWTQRNV